MAENTITINELEKARTGLATDLLLTTRGTAGHKMTFSDFSKYVTETYQAAVAGQNQSIIDALNELHSAIGGPKVAATVAAMTDESAIYVYTGSESGYTAGNWYYYNGSAWTSGGVYNAVAVQTDTALSSAGVPADAKATGEAIANIHIDVDDTLTEAGEAADAKKTGDEISGLKNALISMVEDVSELRTEVSAIEDISDIGIPLTWEQGGINSSGGNTTSNYRIRCASVTIGDYTSFIVTPQSGYSVKVYFYNNGYKSSTDTFTGQKVVEVPDNVETFRMSVYKGDGTSIAENLITPDEGANIQLSYSYKLKDELRNITDKIDENERKFYDSMVTESIFGSIASFPDGADDMPVKSFVVGIEPVQEGGRDPSPDNVSPISGWTSAEIQRSQRFLTWTLENGSISDTGEETTTVGYYRSNYIDIQDAKNINLNFYAPAGGWVLRIVGYNDNKEFTSLIKKTTYSTTGTRNATVDVPENVRYIRISIKTSVVINRFCTDYSYFEIAFPTEAGTVYGGTLDVTNGVLTNKWRYETFATLSATVSYSEGMFYFEATSRIAKNSIEQFLCSKYANYGNYPWATLKSSMPDKSFGTTSASARKYVCFKDSDYTTVADFLAANADTQIAWESVQEYWSEYQLTPTEVRTLLGENNIFADTGDIVNLEYRADTKLYIDRLTAPDSDMIADTNITSGSYFMVNNSLYIATAAIAAGETIVPGTNCTLTNLAAALNALNA